MTRITFILLLLIASCSSPRQDSDESTQNSEPLFVTLPNNLKIQDLTPGTGTEAKSTNYITAHYTGYLEDGDVFDSSHYRNQPLTFRLGSGQLIQGWEIGILGMRVGGKRVLIVPPELGYGENGIAGIIPPNEILRFEIELISVTDAPEPWNLNNRRMVTTASNLQFAVIEPGQGNKPRANDFIEVHYSGYLIDGTLFDSSHMRGQPFRFKVGAGQVIKGWDEALQDMRPGEKRSIILPPELAYGETGAGGTIPPNATLRFDVEFLEIVKE